MFSHTQRLLIGCASLAAVSLFTGCDRSTPEERLMTAVEFVQQGDELSAEMEALKVVEKAGDDPIAVDARLFLAQLYMNQPNRLVEARTQLEAVLDEVSQLEPKGRETLRMYLSVLAMQKEYDKALEVAKKYQEEYASDDGTSVSLRMAQADILRQADRTDEARAIIQSRIDETTETQELGMYQQMYLGTLIHDENTTGAIEYMERQLAAATQPEARDGMMLTLSDLYAQADNYEKSRSYLEVITAAFARDIHAEVDNNLRVSRAYILGQTYLQLRNYPGARRIFQTLYDMGISDSQMAMQIIAHNMDVLARMGEQEAFVGFVNEAHTKYSSIPQMAEVKKYVDAELESGRLKVSDMQDTSTVALRYIEDPNVLWPADLPVILKVPGASTTGTTGTATTTTPTETTDAPTTAPAETPSESETPAEAPVTETPTPEAQSETEEAPAESEAPATAESTPEASQATPADLTAPPAVNP